MQRDEAVASIRGEALTRYYKLEDPVVRAVIHRLCEPFGGGQGPTLPG